MASKEVVLMYFVIGMIVNLMVAIGLGWLWMDQMVVARYVRMSLSPFNCRYHRLISLADMLEASPYCRWRFRRDLARYWPNTRYVIINHIASDLFGRANMDEIRRLYQYLNPFGDKADDDGSVELAFWLADQYREKLGIVPVSQACP